MAKKIIRLTEKQLEDIVRKVIQEQTEDGNENEYFTTEWGDVYKLPQIKNLEDVNNFVNFQPDGSYAKYMKMLRNYGLSYKNQPIQNPLDVSSDAKWSKQKNPKSDLNVAADRLLDFFWDGLGTVAKTGFTEKRLWNTPQFQTAFNNEVYGRKYKLNDVRKTLRNYDDVLEKIVKVQLSKLS